MLRLSTDQNAPLDRMFYTFVEWLLGKYPILRELITYNRRIRNERLEQVWARSTRRMNELANILRAHQAFVRDLLAVHRAGILGADDSLNMLITDWTPSSPEPSSVSEVNFNSMPLIYADPTSTEEEEEGDYADEYADDGGEVYDDVEDDADDLYDGYDGDDFEQQDHVFSARDQSPQGYTSMVADRRTPGAGNNIRVMLNSGYNATAPAALLRTSQRSPQNRSWAESSQGSIGGQSSPEPSQYFEYTLRSSPDQTLDYDESRPDLRLLLADRVIPVAGFAPNHDNMDIVWELMFVVGEVESRIRSGYLRESEVEMLCDHASRMYDIAVSRGGVADPAGVNVTV